MKRILLALAVILFIGCSPKPLGYESDWVDIGGVKVKVQFDPTVLCAVPTLEVTQTLVPTSTPTWTPTPTATWTPTPEPTPTITPIPTTWQRLDTTGGGATTGFAFHPTDPSIVYISTDNGGLYKTVDGGDTWQSATGNMGAYRLGSVAVDPLDGDVIYVAASTDFGKDVSGGATGEIQRSLNGGQSWELVSAEMGFQSSFPNQAAMLIPEGFDSDNDDLSDVIMVGAWTGPANPPVGGIWRSTDEGETFEHLALEDSNIVALRGDAEVLFAVTWEGEIWRSFDLGETWVDITSNMPLAHPSDLAVHPDGSNILYVTCRFNCPTNPVWKTVDGGQTWQPASSGLDMEHVDHWPMLLIDRFNPDTIYVTADKAKMGYGGVWKSMDGGGSWEMMPYNMILPDGRPFFWYQFEGELSIGQTSDGTLFAGDEGVWRYDGREWQPIPIGVGNVRVNAIEIDPFDPDTLYQAMIDRGLYKSVDGGLTFHRVTGSGWPVTVDNYKWNGPYYTNYRHCLLDCSDTCASMGRQASGSALDFAISHQNPGTVYSAFGTGANGMDMGGVNKSTDGGATWKPVGFQPNYGFDLNPKTCVPYGFRHLAIDPTDDSVVFAAQETGRGKLYRTTNGGTTWQTVYDSPSHISGVEVSLADHRLVVFATAGTVYKSELGGDRGSWQQITPPGADDIQTVALSPHNSRVIVIGTKYLGFYYTSDGGLTWVQNPLDGFFAQEGVDPEMATVANPDIGTFNSIMAIVFDPIIPDTFYVGGVQYRRASTGVARITNAGQDWELLPLAGLDHRNVFDLAVDTEGRFLYTGTNGGTYKLEVK